MIEITLPWPPSVNTYWRMWQNRMLISEPGRKYRKAVGDQVLVQGVKSTTGKVRVTIEAYRPDNRKRDLDNLLKAVLDSMAAAGIYKDDALIVDLRIYWAPEIGGYLKVKVEEVGCEENGLGFKNKEN